MYFITQKSFTSDLHICVLNLIISTFHRYKMNKASSEKLWLVQKAENHLGQQHGFYESEVLITESF